MIKYQREDIIPTEEFIEVLKNSTLGERRPVDDPERIEKMISNADIIVTARDAEKLVGIARSISDFTYCTYLSDLAVDIQYQKNGIGIELIRQTKKLAPKAKLILLSAPASILYYPHIGMKRHDNCFYIDTADELN